MSPKGRYAHLQSLHEHVWNEDHRIEWNNTTVIDSAAGTLSRRVKELLHIVKEKTTMNKDEGLKLSAVWKSLFICLWFHFLPCTSLTRHRTSESYKFFFYLSYTQLSILGLSHISNSPDINTCIFTCHVSLISLVICVYPMMCWFSHLG